MSNERRGSLASQLQPKIVLTVAVMAIVERTLGLTSFTK